MAGKILPIALATILGISIGVATFDGEFKEQRKRRLEEEYKREVAAAALQNPSPSSAPSAASSANSEPLSAKMAEVKAPTSSSTSTSSSWSSMLGLWAWSKDKKPATATSAPQVPPPKENNPELKGKP
ncbi:hypothetical protein NX059_008369 [Plenodomus lindquistii]|nr:hypothetical protein NX059_008369 [Plenodomus lindquistii]